MLVVGAKEEELGVVAVRTRLGGDQGQKSLEDFVAEIKTEIAEKRMQAE